MIELKGVFPALTTPFENGEPAMDLLRHNVAAYNGTGVSGYLALGSTGEFPHLTAEEKRRVLEAVVEEAAPAGKPVIAGVGELSTAAAVEAARRAADAGARAAMVVPPFYYRPSMDDDALARHYERVAEASPIPVLLYNIPALAGVTLSPALVERLAGHPNIIGIKDSSGDLARLRAYRRAAAGADNFAVLTGSGGTFLAALLAGADGAILGVADAAPWECVALMEALAAGDLERARILQERIAGLEQAVLDAYGLPGLKCVLDLLGYFGLEPRPPLRPLDPGDRVRVRQMLFETGWLSLC